MGTMDDNLELSLRVEWLEEQMRLIKNIYTILPNSAQNLQIGNSICQMENDVGCATCNENHEDYSRSFCIIQHADGEINLCVETNEWNDSYGDFNTISYPVSYCPRCGRKLRGV